MRAGVVGSQLEDWRGMSLRERAHPVSRSCAVVAVVVLLTGCSAPLPEGTTCEAFSRTAFGVTSDHEPLTAAELSARSSLVVEGTITDVADGRLFGASEDDAGAVHSIVLAVQVDTVREGVTPDGSDDVVHVETFVHGGATAAACRDAMPTDVAGVFYLVPAVEGSAQAPIHDDAAGRPPGQPLFEATDPQGLALAPEP